MREKWRAQLFQAGDWASRIHFWWTVIVPFVVTLFGGAKLIGGDWQTALVVAVMIGCSSAIVATLAFPAEPKPQGWTSAPRVVVRYDPGTRGSPRAIVQNLGEAAEFRAMASVAAIFEPAANQPNYIRYSLAWAESGTAVHRIPKDGWASLVLAESSTNHEVKGLTASLCEMHLIEASPSGPTKIDWFRWIMLRDWPPLVVLDIAVVAEPPLAEPFAQRITLEGGDYGGVNVIQGDAGLNPELRVSKGPLTAKSQ